MYAADDKNQNYRIRQMRWSSQSYDWRSLALLCLSRVRPQALWCWLFQGLVKKDVALRCGNKQCTRRSQGYFMEDEVGGMIQSRRPAGSLRQQTPWSKGVGRLAIVVVGAGCQWGRPARSGAQFLVDKGGRGLRTTFQWLASRRYLIARGNATPIHAMRAARGCCEW